MAEVLDTQSNGSELAGLRRRASDIRTPGEAEDPEAEILIDLLESRTNAKPSTTANARLSRAAGLVLGDDATVEPGLRLRSLNMLAPRYQEPSTRPCNSRGGSRADRAVRCGSDQRRPNGIRQLRDLAESPGQSENSWWFDDAQKKLPDSVTLPSSASRISLHIPHVGSGALAARQRTIGYRLSRPRCRSRLLHATVDLAIFDFLARDYRRPPWPQ